MHDHSGSTTIHPARAVIGSLRLPGDKSISHRYAMLAGIAHGPSRLTNFATGADCASTLACLRALGCAIAEREDRTLEIEGRGGVFLQPRAELDCGNSGSTMRMLAGLLAAQDLEVQLTGDSSLSRRPMRRVIEPLRAMGAEISASDGHHAPLQIRAGKLRGISYTLPVASAQVKSAVLLAGMQAEGTTVVAEPHASRDHTELALRAFGARVDRTQNSVSIRGEQQLHALEGAIPGDISSAAFFLCAAAVCPGSNLVIEGLLMNPTRAAILDVLAQLGARIGVVQLEQQHGELVGTVVIEHQELLGAHIRGGQSVALMDELPVIAALAPYTRDGIIVEDARELRVKEVDRIAAVVRNLRAIGAEVEETDDGMRIPGGQTLRGGEINSFGDHRIAMAFAVAALRAQGPTAIHGADCVRISFPEFWQILETVCEP